MRQVVNKNNASVRDSGPVKLNFLLALVVALCGMLAGYFATIYEIKMELTGKAENDALISLEKRVLGLEFYLKESMLTRSDFQQYKETLERRLYGMEMFDEK